ncbi:Universal stress protein [Burkholderiales bacterium 8X]|nr:Universal stress protein [Burkholderiales bacterium 8X]
MYSKILVLVDGSETSRLGLDEAIRLASVTGGRLRLFHVIDELGFALSMDAFAGRPGDWLEQLRAEGHAVLQAAKTIAEQAGVQAEGVLHEAFARTLHDVVNDEVTASGAELIVTGTHGRRGFGRAVLGSNAEQILRHANVPVLLVRAPEARAKAGAAEKATRISLPTGALAFE